ncbi:MAG: hypothetical protein HYR56_28310 [Acidobacteria bacterium]|nr:hypothetical protein [Acidobacteriota bacterium]MBI3497357.1 hypothetical protein [Pseudomonadota bacterium]
MKQASAIIETHRVIMDALEGAVVKDKTKAGPTAGGITNAVGASGVKPPGY